MITAGPQIYLISAELSAAQARFAGCSGSCQNLGNWRAGTIRSERSAVLFSSAVLTATGLDVVYDGPGVLRYGACPGRCYDSRLWKTTTVDSGSGPASFPAIAVDSGGGLHVVYEPGNLSQLRYSECTANCLSSASWSSATIDQADEILYSTIGSDATGRLHVLYYALWRPGMGPQALKYATCVASCADRASWSITLVDEFAGVPPFDATPSLAFANDNRLNVAYWIPSAVRLATCASSCSSSAPWTRTTVATTAAPDIGSLGLAIGPSGALHLVYAGSAVRYATCVSSCVDPTMWQQMTVDSSTSPGVRTEYVALAVDYLDQPHFALSSGGLLRYAWRQQ